MTHSLPYPIIVLFWLAAAVCLGQDTTATGYFNKASKEYIKVDKLSALKTLDEGLRSHPGDPRLLSLAEELLKEEQQQQDQEQQQQEQEQNNDQEENGNEEKDKEESGQDQEKKDGDDGQEKEQQDDPGSGEDDRRKEQQQQQGKREPGTIAPHDARRMLDALDREEKEVQEKVRARQRPASRIPIEKDW